MHLDLIPCAVDWSTILFSVRNWYGVQSPQLLGASKKFRSFFPVQEKVAIRRKTNFDVDAYKRERLHGNLRHTWGFNSFRAIKWPDSKQISTLHLGCSTSRLQVWISNNVPAAAASCKEIRKKVIELIEASKSVNGPTTTDQHIPKSYADIAKAQKLKNPEYALVLKPEGVPEKHRMNRKEVQEFSRKLANAVPDSNNNFMVKSLQPTAEKGVKITFGTEEGRKNFDEAFKKKQPELRLTASDTKEPKPWIIVRLVPKEASNETVLQELERQIGIESSAVKITRTLKNQDESVMTTAYVLEMTLEHSIRVLKAEKLMINYRS